MCRLRFDASKLSSILQSLHYRAPLRSAHLSCPHDPERQAISNIQGERSIVALSQSTTSAALQHNAEPCIRPYLQLGWTLPQCIAGDSTWPAQPQSLHYCQHGSQLELRSGQLNVQSDPHAVALILAPDSAVLLSLSSPRGEQLSALGCQVQALHL